MELKFLMQEYGWEVFSGSYQSCGLFQHHMCMEGAIVFSHHFLALQYILCNLQDTFFFKLYK